MENETIVAQCTPKGPGAIALIRMSGQDAISIADKISQLASGKKLSCAETHTINYGWVIDKNNKNVDQVLFLLMRGPQTFTGQDTVEITCHNNPFIIEKIISKAIENGARIAQSGEFSKRAFLNGKVDLVQAEAINELIHSQTQMALKNSLAQLEGSLSAWVNNIQEDLLRAMSLSEASFEFIDEEENMEFGIQIKQIVDKTLKIIEKLKITFNKQQQIRQGIRIAIIGSVNAGKSSLFNSLLNQKRAIVTNIAGTTRDVIEAGMYKNGNYQTIIDTAGLRQTDNIIEQEGIKKSFEQAQKADIILLVYDGSTKLSTSEKKIYNDIVDTYKNKVIIVQNKIDLSPLILGSIQFGLQAKSLTMHGELTGPEWRKVPYRRKSGRTESCYPILVSSLENKNIHLLEQEINKKIKSLFSQIESPFLLNQRHYNILLSLKNKLNNIIPMLSEPIAYELVSYHLKETLENISELSGKTITEQSMNKIFNEFCIGK